MKSALSELRSALYLAGQMTGGETAAFERDLAAASPEEKVGFGQLNDAAALLVMASVPLRKAPPSARDVVMRRASINASGPKSAEVDKFTYLMNDEGWEPLAFTGARIKRLFAHPDGRHRAFLLELEPGAHVPEHQHEGYEECLILKGDLINEGRRLGPGDYVRAAVSTAHLEVYTESGCVCLVIASAA